MGEGTVGRRKSWVKEKLGNLLKEGLEKRQWLGKGRVGGRRGWVKAWLGEGKVGLRKS